MGTRSLLLFGLGWLLFSYPFLHFPPTGEGQALYLFLAWGGLILLAGLWLRGEG